MCPLRLDDATVLPTDPMGQGIIQDSYSDKFDGMACCRGDYNAFFRVMAGWVPSAERYDLNFLTRAGSASKQSLVSNVVLWPFDRGESRGKLKVITMRISVDELLVLSYRWGGGQMS